MFSHAQRSMATTTKSAMVFPASLDGLTPDLLSVFLSQLYPGTVVSNVVVLQRARCGDGVASTADRLRLGLVLAANPGQIPTTVVVKCLMLHPILVRALICLPWCFCHMVWLCL